MKLKLTDDQVMKLLDSVKYDILAGDTSWDGVIDQIKNKDGYDRLSPCSYTLSHTRDWCGHVLCRAG